MSERKVSNKPLGKLDMHRYLFLTSSWNALVKVNESVWDMALLNYQNTEKMLLDMDVGKEDPESLGIRSKQVGLQSFYQAKGKVHRVKSDPRPWEIRVLRGWQLECMRKIKGANKKTESGLTMEKRPEWTILRRYTTTKSLVRKCSKVLGEMQFKTTLRLSLISARMVVKSMTDNKYW